MDEAYTYNEALSDILARGRNIIGIHLLEQEHGKYMSKIRERQAETAGFLSPSKQAITVDASLTPNNVLGSLRKYAK